MATRARIATQLSNGQFISSYHHYDGYPAGLGYNLIENYDDDAKTLEAIKMGDASYWKENIHPNDVEHSFDSPEDDVSVFYNRDRGESRTGPFVFNSLEELLEGYSMAGEEYLYVRQNSQWGMKSRYDDCVAYCQDAKEKINIERERMLQRMADYHLS